MAAVKIGASRGGRLPERRPVSVKEAGATRRRAAGQTNRAAPGGPKRFLDNPWGFLLVWFVLPLLLIALLMALNLPALFD